MKSIFLIAISLFSFFPVMKDINTQTGIIGAWAAKQGNTSFTLVFGDGYFSFVSFDIPGKKFIRTYGGTFTESGGELHANIEFDSMEKEAVGSHKHFTASITGNLLTLDTGNGIKEWTSVDAGKQALAGNWRITGRMRNGQIEEIPLRARKTVKLLSGTRFQWMAINTETKEFFGTGGGTYTFQDGKYREHIEFFSRDSSRVGATLTFDGSINNKDWTHKGLSSKGEPIHEVWTREK
jgi:hypothetical protein